MNDKNGIIIYAIVTIVAVIFVGYYVYQNAVQENQQNNLSEWESIADPTPTINPLQTDFSDNTNYVGCINLHKREIIENNWSENYPPNPGDITRLQGEMMQERAYCNNLFPLHK